MSATITDQSRQMMAEGRISAAVTMVTDAARQGDGEALYELGRWRVFGHLVPRDFAIARDLFERSAATGYSVGALTYAVFVAIGAGGASDWQKSFRLIGKVAEHDALAARQKLLLDKMTLDPSGYPTSAPVGKPLSHAPKLAIIRQLLTPEECAHIRMLASPRLIPSVVVDPATGREAANPIRTSDGAVLGPVQMDLVVEAINRRIAIVCGTTVEQGEPLVVLRYNPGQQYRQHHDCLPGESNQREQTMIIFLNEEFEGGETYFPAINAYIRGATGDAIYFTNTTAGGQVDELSRHAGLPVSHGEKWICTRWIRAGPFDPWGMRSI